jgi:cytochrome c-type biogenesis protein CcmH/NrfG
MRDGGRTGELMLAIAEAKAGIGDVNGAYRALERARGLAEDPLPVERLEGLVARSAGDLLRAGIAFQAVLKTDPQNVEAWELLGEIEEDQGNVTRAEGCYKKVLELSRGHGGAAISLARLYGARGEFHAAVNVLVDLLIEQPADTEALLALGRTLLEAGRDSAASDAFRKVIARDPRNVAAHYLQGIALVRQSDYRAAVAAWRTVIDLHGDSELADQARRHIQRAATLIESAMEAG